MEAYLIKSSVALLVFYLLYRVVLHNESSNQVKRFVGLACVLFCPCLFLLPNMGLVPIATAPVVFQNAVETTTTLQQRFSATLPQESMSAFLFIYLLGVGGFATRFLVGVVRLIHLYLISEKMSAWGFTVAITSKKISPFTFFNLLFIQKDALQKANIQALVLHEQVHRNQRHTIDTLLLQLLSILFWFNPIIWLFQKEIQAQHEFIADNEVLKRGFSKTDYQQMLFEEQTGVFFQPVNYLSSKTSLKQRFSMMEKPKFKTESSYLKAVLFLPLMVIAIVASSFSFQLPNGSTDFLVPTFKLYTEHEEVDLKKGIPKATEKLYLVATPPKGSKITFQVASASLAHVSGGLGHGMLKSGDTFDLHPLFVEKRAMAGDILALAIEEYLTRDQHGTILTIKPSKKVFMNIPVY